MSIPKLIDRCDTIDSWAEQTIDGMDLKSLVQMAYEKYYNELEKMSDSEIVEHISNFDPDFLEGKVKK